MIYTTGSTKEFMEQLQGKIFIYGIGNVGEWVSSYFEKLDIDYEGFFDGNIQMSEYYYPYKDKKIYSVKDAKVVLKEEKQVRVIIASIHSSEILMDILMYFPQDIEISILLPWYLRKEINDEIGKKAYSANRMLGWFRKKMLINDVPTVLSNDCSAVGIYKLTDSPFLSPTISMIIKPTDFLKICDNPQKYLGEEMVFWHYEKRSDRSFPSPVGLIDDVQVSFQHVDPKEDPIAKWNERRKRVDFNNMIYVLSDRHYKIKQDEIDRFLRLKNKKIITLINDVNLYTSDNIVNCKMTKGPIVASNMLIENEFDLVKWLNDK